MADTSGEKLKDDTCVTTNENQPAGQKDGIEDSVSESVTDKPLENLKISDRESDNDLISHKVTNCTDGITSVNLGSDTSHKCENLESCNEPDTEGRLGHYMKVLTQEEQDKLEADTSLVTEFKRNKFEKEAQRNWDIFYKRNTTKFFKDRHWTTREFEELCGPLVKGQQVKLLEVGCGVGNFLFPLIEDNRDMFIYACDFSPRAVQFVKENPLYHDDRCHAFQCDITQPDLQGHIPSPGVDLVTLIFVLSAIHPDKMLQTLQNIYKVLQPGGCVLFRDYGLYDHAMLRFAKGHKLGENFYVRQDGTRAYYFSEDHLASLFTSAGFTVITNKYVNRETINKKEGLCVQRVFIQGKFQKPS